MNRNNPNQPLSLDGQIDEARVRRALGLTATATPHQQRPEQARQRHRFVADGAVPVVMLSRGDSESGGLKERLVAVEAALESERAAHAATKRALFDAQASNQALQTRLGHAELSHAETLATERNARRLAEEALEALRSQPAPAPAPPVQVAAPDAEPKRAARQQAAAKLPRLPRAPREDKPVRWWTPSYKAKRG